MKKKKEKRILKNKENRATILRAEGERVRGADESVRARGRECARMCVRRCVCVNLEEEEKITHTLEEPSSAYFTHRDCSTRLCLWIHIYTHTYIHKRTPIHTHTHLYRKKKRGKNVRALLRREGARSPPLPHYYRVTPYVCLYYRGVHLKSVVFLELLTSNEETVW